MTRPQQQIVGGMSRVITISSHLIAHMVFTYYASVQNNSDLLFQYLVQNFPSYFPEVQGGHGGRNQGITSLLLPEQMLQSLRYHVLVMSNGEYSLESVYFHHHFNVSG